MNYATTYITRAIVEVEDALASIDERIASKREDIEALCEERGHVAAALSTLRSYVRAPVGPEPEVRSRELDAEPKAQISNPESVIPESPVAAMKPRTREGWRRALLTLLLDGPQSPTVIRLHFVTKDRASTRRKLNAMQELGLVEATGVTHTRRWAITEAGRA